MFLKRGGGGGGGVGGVQGFTVLTSIPNDSYSHWYSRSLPLKNSEVPDSMTKSTMHTLEEEMATHSLQYSCLENPVERGACWATVIESQRIGQD